MSTFLATQTLIEAEQPLNNSAFDDLVDPKSEINNNVFENQFSETPLQTHNSYVNDNNSSWHRVFDSNKLYIPPSTQSVPKTNFEAIQKWEGFVIDVGKNSFSARLIPIFGEGPDQFVKIGFVDIDNEDRILVEPGAVFYWSIGYDNSLKGRMRASIIRFRRLPAWSIEDFKSAENDVKKLKGLFINESRMDSTRP